MSPNANLDVTSKKDLIDILLFLNSKATTILITSHIIEELQQIINHLIIIDHKQLFMIKTLIIKKEKIKDIYQKVVKKQTNNLFNLNTILDLK